MTFSFKPKGAPPRERIYGALSARAAAKGVGGKLTRMADKSFTATHKCGGGANHRMTPWGRMVLRFWMYFYKMRGKNPVTFEFSMAETLWSFGGAFIAMLMLGLLNTVVLERTEPVLLLGSFGASAMLVFGAPAAPFAQPRNVIGGHMVSALAGVFVHQMFGADLWFAASLAVALSVAAMHVTATLHPPGGATALIAVVGDAELKSLGYGYAFFPVGLSVALMVLVGVIYNNLSKNRRYPLYWW